MDRFLVEVGEMAAHFTHWSRKDGPAFHKPLLLLLVIARIQHGELTSNQIRFSDFARDLKELLIQFGGREGLPKPEYPFHYLQSSPFWLLTGARDASSTPRVADLKDTGCFAAFPDDLFKALQHPANSSRAAGHIIQQFWPVETVGDELRRHLELDVTFRYPKRSKEFTDRVLENYAYRCAVCGFDALHNKMPFGLDAAHIRWFKRGGPDTHDNGLALCKLHHWALDCGVFGLRGKECLIRISSRFIPRDQLTRQLISSLEGQALAKPLKTSPSQVHVQWHWDNIFLG